RPVTTHLRSRVPASITNVFLSTQHNSLDLISFPTRRSSDLVNRILVSGNLALAAIYFGFLLGKRHPFAGRGQGTDGHHQCHQPEDRKSTRLNSSHVKISYGVLCWKKKIKFCATR